MSGTSSPDLAMQAFAKELDADDVEQFLRQMPEFFQQRPDLLLAMDLPHGGPGSVSLIARQVNLLRERNIDMRTRLADLTQNALHNETLFTASHRMVLELLGCHDPEQLGTVIEGGLRAHYGVDHASMQWFDTARSVNEGLLVASTTQQQVVAGLLRQGRAYCGIFRPEEMQALFGAGRCEGSAALAPLVLEGTLLGVLAVGSNDTKRYRNDTGTVFLEHLADVLMALPLVAQSTEA